MPRNVEPVSSLTMEIERILGGLATLQIADVAREHVRELVRQSPGVAALHFNGERVVVVPRAVVDECDRRIVRERARFIDVAARVGYRLVDVPAPLALAGIGPD